MSKFKGVKEVLFVRQEDGRSHNLSHGEKYLILDRESKNRLLVQNDDGDDISVSSDCFEVQ